MYLQFSADVLVVSIEWRDNLITESIYRLVSGRVLRRFTGEEPSSLKAKFHYAIWSQTGPKLVGDLQRPEIWPITYLGNSELARASRSATSLGPVCDQDSVMEFGLDQLLTGL